MRDARPGKNPPSNGASRYPPGLQRKERVGFSPELLNLPGHNIRTIYAFFARFGIALRHHRNTLFTRLRHDNIPSLFRHYSVIIPSTGSPRKRGHLFFTSGAQGRLRASGACSRLPHRRAWSRVGGNAPEVAFRPIWARRVSWYVYIVLSHTTRF